MTRDGKAWSSKPEWPKGLRLRRENGVYYFSYRERGNKKTQKVKSLGVTDLKAAIELAEHMRRDLDREGKLSVSKYEVKSLDTVIQYFMDRQDISDKTKMRHGNMFEHLKTFLMQVCPEGLHDVANIPCDEDLLEKYKEMRLNCKQWEVKNGGVSGKKTGVSVSTVNQEMGLFKRLFDGCAGILFDMPNPFKVVNFINNNPNPKDKQILTADEIPLFLETAKNFDELKGAKTNHGDELYEIFYTYLNTGMRDTELRFLEWKDVDFEDGRIWVRDQKVVKEKRTVVLADRSLGAPEYLREKCKNMGRQEKIFKTLGDAENFAENYQFTFRTPELLMELKVSDFSDDFENFNYERSVEWTVKKKKERAIPMSKGVRAVLEKRFKEAKSNLVFPDSEGGLIRYRLRDRLVRVCKEIGADRITELHSLRRTFATIARKNGIKMETLQEILGHTSITTTIDLYAKYTDEEGKAEMLKLDGVFELEEQRRVKKMKEEAGVVEVDNETTSNGKKQELKLVFYAINGNQVCSLGSKCPKCGADWETKDRVPSCPGCGVWMRRDVKFLIKDQVCPCCGEQKVDVGTRSCGGCNVYFDEGMAVLVE
jgi:integrase